MLVYILMLNSISFGTEYFSQNFPTQHFNHLEKLLVIRSFPSILQTIQIHTFFRLILTTHNTNRIGLHDKLLVLTRLFTPTLFSDAFITLFGYPCSIVTQF